MRNISFSYPRCSSCALKDVSIDIEKGEFVTLLGANGSGKSTLSLILAGLLEEDSGFSSIAVEERRRRCRIVFQNPESQIIGSTVEKDVAFGPENLLLPSSEIRKRTDEALFKVGLHDKRYSSPRSLSGGEKQKLAFASVLALESEIIILDEVTAFLERQSAHDILSGIKRECTGEGKTVILVTHSVEEALLSDRVFIMDGGKTVMSGKPRDILTYSLIARIGLVAPFALYLSHELGLERCLTVGELSDGISRRLQNG